MTARLNPVGRAVLMVASSAVALAGCTGSNDASSVGGSTVASVSVDVDTPALRAQKAATDIAPCPDANGRPARDPGLPAVTLPCLGGGRAVDLARLTGTPMVVNLWGQYCGPCRSEVPMLQQLHASLGKRVAFLGIDYLDTQPDAAIAFAGDLGVTYPLVADPDALVRPGLLEQGIPIPGVPITLFISSSGEITHATSGPITSTDELTSLISQYLHVDVPQVAGS